MMALYSLALSLALVLSAPWWLLRMLTTGRYRAGFAGRLGRLPASLRSIANQQQKNVLWIHAVSVGEVLAATELVRELRRRLPDVVIAVSTTTATGQALARARFPDTPVFFFPLDLAFVVRRYLRALEPRMLVLLESELWPRLRTECARRRIPVAVANARMSDRSFRRALRLRPAWRRVLGQVTAFLAQGEETAERLRQLGAPSNRVAVTGNLKFDLRAPAASPLLDEFRKRLPPAARVLVCGSTLDGEEALLLRAWPQLAASVPSAVMVLAPRHPERFELVETLVQKAGLRMLPASKLAADCQPISPGTIILLDTIGDLAAVYSIATAAFVGGSLVPAGGHNPLEPARFAVPVAMGPSVENFREIVASLGAHTAIRLVSAEELPEVLRAALARDPAMAAMGRRGQAVFQSNAGATERTVDQLLRFLGTAQNEVLRA